MIQHRFKHSALCLGIALASVSLTTIAQQATQVAAEKEIEEAVKKVINDIGADGMKDMGKIMGIVTKKLMGKADGKTISTIVRNNLN